MENCRRIVKETVRLRGLCIVLIVSVLCGCPGLELFSPSTPDLKGLDATPTTITVGWRSVLFADEYSLRFSNTTTYSRHLGLVLENPQKIIIEHSDTSHYEYTLHGLEPDTIYYLTICPSVSYETAIKLGYDGPGGAMQSEILEMQTLEE